MPQRVLRHTAFPAIHACEQRLRVRPHPEQFHEFARARSRRSRHRCVRARPAPCGPPTNARISTRPSGARFGHFDETSDTPVTGWFSMRGDKIPCQCRSKGQSAASKGDRYGRRGAARYLAEHLGDTRIDVAHQVVCRPDLGSDDHRVACECLARVESHPPRHRLRAVRPTSHPRPPRIRSRPAASAMLSVRNCSPSSERREERPRLRARLGRVLPLHLLDLLALGEEAAHERAVLLLHLEQVRDRWPQATSAPDPTRSRRPRAARRVDRGTRGPCGAPRSSRASRR